MSVWVIAQRLVHEAARGGQGPMFSIQTPCPSHGGLRDKPTSELLPPLLFHLRANPIFYHPQRRG